MPPIAMWSGPRNVSTALMYSFGNRRDVQVFDEPFFGNFLRHTGVWRPSREEVLESMELDFNKVLKDVKAASQNSRVFLKNMGNHLEGGSLNVLSEFRNVILVRKPDAVIASYTKQVDLPTSMDLCYAHQLQILEYLKKEGQPYYVVDSDDVKKAPEETLRALCQYLEIPFMQSMLKWPAGKRSEDGVWAKYWYHNVHQSTCFLKFEEKVHEVPKHLMALYESCLKDYLMIKEYRNE